MGRGRVGGGKVGEGEVLEQLLALSALRVALAEDPLSPG